MASVWGELKRRNVVRVAVAYAIAAWLLIEITATTFPILKLPDWSVTLVTAFVLVGFPLAMIFAWAYELTPEGLKREHEVDRSESITHITGRKLDYFIIAALVLALGYFAFDKFVLDPSRDAELVQATTEAIAEQAAEFDNAETADKSIAVLAFTDLSPEGDQEYFSDGISEELLNVLSKIPGLRVAARTSSFQFKGENRDIIDIGEQLNVAHVLEGSVRKAGVQIRITAQLVDASNGFHLWSETYDRELEDIFAVQDEISAAIVEALKEHLGLQVAAAPRMIAAANTEAHDAYLRGRHLVVQRSRTTLEGAVRELEKALALDPDYALAHAELAVATLLLIRSSYGDLTDTEAFTRATPHAEQAMALDPTLPEAHAANGFLLYMQGNPEEALPHFEQAIQINPNYSIVYSWMGSVLHDGLGRYKEGHKMNETSRRLDPMSIVARSNYQMQLVQMNRLDEARRELEKLRYICPDCYVSGLGRMLPASEWAGQVRAQLDSLRLDPVHVKPRRRLALQFAVIGLEQEALAVLEYPLVTTFRILAKPGDAVSVAEADLAADSDSAAARQYYGLALAGAGDYQRARPILEDMWQQSSGRITNWGLFGPASAVALIAMRQAAGDEDDIEKLFEALRDNERRMHEAGYVRPNLDVDLDVSEGMVAYLEDDYEQGLALIANAEEDGTFILQSVAYMQALYDDPGFAPILARQEERQLRERQKFLDVVCTDNPYAAVWQPAKGTCERFAAAGAN